MNNTIFSQIRKTIEFHKSVSVENTKSGDHYRLDRGDAYRYFEIHPKWREKIFTYFRSLRKRKNKIVHVDICGRASGRSLGADKSYCFSLKASEITKAFGGPDQIFFDGDIFNSGDFSRFINTIKKVPPALVTFEPVAGLQSYSPEKKKETGAPLYKQITYARLAKRLSAIAKVVRPGGYIYMEKPFQFDADDFADSYYGKTQNNYTLSLALKKLARKLKCRIDINSSIGGPYFLMQTREE